MKKTTTNFSGNLRALLIIKKLHTNALVTWLSVAGLKDTVRMLWQALFQKKKNKKKRKLVFSNSGKLNNYMPMQ